MTSEITYHGPVIVFDLDDTLYSESEYVASGYRAVADAVHKKTGADAEDAFGTMMMAHDTGLNPFDVLLGYLESEGAASAITIQDCVEIYRTHAPRINLRDGARRLLDRLRAKGIRAGLLTDGRSVTQRAKIKALGIEEYFHPDDIVISGETGHEKTDPDGFRHFVHRYPEAAGFYYIGDNPAKDFRHPNRMGWTTACLADDGRNIHPQDVPHPACDDACHTIGSLDEVAGIAGIG